MTFEVCTASVEQTQILGRLIGALAVAGQCIALDGMLGVGKTQLVRGIAVGAKVEDISLVCSPTYCLLNIYPADAHQDGSKTVYHLDAYRVRNAEDFAAVGFEELLEQGGLVVLEWAGRVPQLLPADHLALRGQVEDETSRSWHIDAGGPVAQRLLAQIAAHWPRALTAGW